jgi:hypothetical protein
MDGHDAAAAPEVLGGGPEWGSRTVLSDENYRTPWLDADQPALPALRSEASAHPRPIAPDEPTD